MNIDTSGKEKIKKKKKPPKKPAMSHPRVISHVKCVYTESCTKYFN